MFPGSLKIKIIHKWVQIISPCSQWLARCRVTVQRCSAAPAPKLSGTEKLLLCHRLTPRRSFLPDWQRVGVPTCSLGLRFRPRWAQRGIRFQCWHIFPLCAHRGRNLRPNEHVGTPTLCQSGKKDLLGVRR